jgi:acyl dehydratase
MGLISIAIDMRNQHDVLLMRQMNIVMFGCHSIAGEAAGEEHHKRAQFPATQHINMQHVSDPDPAPISILSARPIDDARAQGWESGVSYALGSYEFKRDEMVDFAQKFDPQPFHLSDEAAAKTHFGALAASGWQTASAFFRCLDAADKMLSPSSQDMAQRTSLGFYHLKWIKPVFAGDHVDFYAKIISREQHTDNICLELMRVSGYKQNSELCFDVYYYSRLTKSC